MQIDVRLCLAHGGTAVALAYAGQARRVVLTLVTAIGNGFSPPAGDYRRLAEGSRF